LATPESKRRLVAVAILAVGALIAGLGVGAALGYEQLVSEKASPAPSTSGSEDGGILAKASVQLSALGVEVARDLRLDRTLPVDAQLPGLSVHRDVDGLGVEAPVDAKVDLDLATGSHAKRATAADGTTSAQAQQVAVLSPSTEVAAIAAAAFAGAGLLAYFWASVKTWAYKVLVVPLIPLYAHVTRAEVFDNEVRERIFAAIRDAPGVSASELARATGVSWGTTIYHLEVLEQTRMVVSMRDGRYRRYFQNGAALESDKKVVALLRNPMTSQVVDAIRATPGVTQKDLANAMGMSPQALHWHLARLVKAGVVEKRREGRMVRHFSAS
jgi:DNA-binding transcriptional ArsR family regulator